MPEWEAAPKEVIDMADDLIRQHHQSLLDARIGILFRDVAPVSNGKVTWGKASKVDAKWQPLLKRELDFIIWLAYDVWRTVLDHKQRVALLDHELCHCTMEDGEPKMRAHDIEEFSEIVERHGLWRNDLEQMYEAMQQSRFPFNYERQGFVEGVELK